MSKRFEVTKNVSKIVHLPKSAKDNRNKQNQRIPMSKEQAIMLYDVDFSITSLRRTARSYYGTSQIGDTLTLINEVNKNFIKCDFKPCDLGYITIKVYRRNMFFIDVKIPKPKYNSDFFKNVLNHKLL